MKKQTNIFLVVILVVVSIIFGTIYVTNQQLLRIGANSPQIQLAEDMAKSLDNGTNPVSVANSKVDIGSSLATFIIIYAKSGQVVSGNGYLNNKIPTVPMGVLQHSEGKEYNFVTWQPQNNVRIASVSVSAKNYYVFSGRSLKEVEKQEQSTLLFAILGWFGTIVVVGIGFGLVNIIHKKHNKEYHG
jgi:hypothetical protein